MCKVGPRPSLTSPSIAVEHGHVDVRGASVGQQAVIQGRALTCRHVVSERHETRTVTAAGAAGSARALPACRSPAPLPT